MDLTINLVRHRPIIKLAMPFSWKKAASQVTGMIAQVAIISSISGYSALILNRNVPTALALGSLGAVGISLNQLKEQENDR